MPNQVKSASEIRALVAAELGRTEACADIDPASLIVVGPGSNWMVTLLRDSSRIDEARLATVCEISRRPASTYHYAEPSGT